MSINLDKKIVIIGGGPTGLGAAIRLRETGHTNWVLLEKDNRFGGLSATDIDNNGFLWDIGGHVTFSHYNYFDDVINHYVKDWVSHEREAWIWDRDRFIPYPFQNNIHRLRDEEIVECLTGLIEVQDNKNKPYNFDEWLICNFGIGIYKAFLRPYNMKVWDRPLHEMSVDWMGERVSKVDLKRIISNTIKKQDDVSWGPNNTFQFPLNGGTGAIWENIGKSFSSGVQLNSVVKHVDLVKKEVVYTKNGEDHIEKYDYLINTMPLDNFMDVSKHSDLKPFLDSNPTTLIGLGFKGKITEELKTKCWMYFPNQQQPFYRCTVFSNYSYNNVPAEGYWSLMFEVSNDRYIDDNHLLEEVIEGALEAKLFKTTSTLSSTWFNKVDHGYPIPSANRDKELNRVQAFLMNNNVYSRGRFGGWKYEVGNMDHSFMQGVEAINNILFGTEESTYFYPNHVNARGKTDSGYKGE